MKKIIFIKIRNNYTCISKGTCRGYFSFQRMLILEPVTNAHLRKEISKDTWGFKVFRSAWEMFFLEIYIIMWI